MGCACVKWFVRECARVREGMPPSLHFRTAPGRCVSLFTILPVVVSRRVDVRADVRALCVHCIARLGGDCVVRAPCCVRLGLCVKLCMRVCEDLPPSLRFRTASSCEASKPAALQRS